MEIIKKKCNIKGCNKIIEGISESQVEYNLKIHQITHNPIKKDTGGKQK